MWEKTLCCINEAALPQTREGQEVTELQLHSIINNLLLRALTGGSTLRRHHLWCSSHKRSQITDSVGPMRRISEGFVLTAHHHSPPALPSAAVFPSCSPPRWVDVSAGFTPQQHPNWDAAERGQHRGSSVPVHPGDNNNHPQGVNTSRSTTIRHRCLPEFDGRETHSKA